jgi:hypothetical protein
MDTANLKYDADFLEALMTLIQKEYWDKVAAYSHMPKGNLYIKNRTGRRAEYYIYTEADGVKRQQYIPVAERADILNLLSRRNLLKTEINGAVADLQPILNRCKPFIEKTVSMMKQLPVTNSFPVSVSEKQGYTQYLRYHTEHGEQVRSKSEVIIANLLQERGICYFYEKALLLDRLPVYPDFTVVHPYTGRLWIWEHLGMMDDAKYRAAWEQKRERYRQAGITEETNLILTEEGYHGALDVKKIIDIIEKTFTYKRYKLLEKEIRPVL